MSVANDIVQGLICSMCMSPHPSEAGYPCTCKECYDPEDSEHNPLHHHYPIFVNRKPKKEPCKICGKKVAGMAQHLYAKHGVNFPDINGGDS